MKTILVTGSNGLLGQKLISLVRKTKRANLIATSKGPNRYPSSDGYVYAEMDISNEDQIKSTIQHYKPEVIINTAAITNVDTCHTEQELCHIINVKSVEYLVKACEEYNIHFIHLSTDFVFDGEDGPYAEDALPNPVSVYGRSKTDAEDIVKASSCKWAIIRTVLVYGITANMSRSNIVLWAKSSLEREQVINVVDDQWRTPTLAEDLADGCLLVAEKGAEGIYHISGKDMMTVYQLVKQVAEFWELDSSLIKPISSASLNQAAKRPVKTGFILDKAIRDLGYQPHSFQEGLEIQDQQFNGSEV